jgi:hypothetical protein
MLPSASAGTSVMEDIAIEKQVTAPSNLPGIPAADADQAPSADAPAETPAN